MKQNEWIIIDLFIIVVLKIIDLHWLILDNVFDSFSNESRAARPPCIKPMEEEEEEKEEEKEKEEDVVVEEGKVEKEVVVEEIVREEEKDQVIDDSNDTLVDQSDVNESIDEEQEKSNIGANSSPTNNDGVVTRRISARNNKRKIISRSKELENVSPRSLFLF